MSNRSFCRPNTLAACAYLTALETRLSEHGDLVNQMADRQKVMEALESPVIEPQRSFTDIDSLPDKVCPLKLPDEAKVTSSKSGLGVDLDSCKDTVTINGSTSATVTFTTRHELGQVKVISNGEEVLPISPGVYVLQSGSTYTPTLPKQRKCNQRLHGPQSKDRWR